MKKKVFCIICAILLLVLLVPFNISQYDDGGTVQITSLTYSIVMWNKLDIHLNEDGSTSGGFYENTCIYLFPNNFKKLSELWELRH